MRCRSYRFAACASVHRSIGCGQADTDPMNASQPKMIATKIFLAQGTTFETIHRHL
jgi:hypothetical protein